VPDWAYNQPDAEPDIVCSSENLHWQLAQCFDLSGDWRVEPIGEDRARVIVTRQGYVELIRNEDGKFDPGFMATGSDAECPD